MKKALSCFLFLAIMSVLSACITITDAEPNTDSTANLDVTDAIPNSTYAIETVPETDPVPETTPETAPVPEATPETAPVPETTPETDPVPETAPENTNATTSSIRPEFKEAMDTYEAFYQDYCSFMKKYSENPTDLSMLTEYSSMLIKLNEMNQAFAAWDSADMSNEELKYYLDVNNRITKMLVDVAG